MAGLPYRIEQKVFGFDKTKTPKFVATAQRSSTIGADKVIDQVAIRTGLSRAMCRVVVDTLAEAMGTWLLEGHGVALGNLGYMKPAIVSKSAVTRGEEDIVRKKVLFQPTKQFKQMIEGMSVELIRTRADEDEDADAPAGGGTDTSDGTEGSGGTGGTPNGNGGVDLE